MNRPNNTPSSSPGTPTVTEGGSLPGSDATVSVIIPTYRRPDALARAIRSVLAQTWPPAQIIVVDDGSGDETPEVVRSFPAVRLIQQENSGPAAARNRGLKEATSKYVASLDHDDVWDPGFLATAITALETHQADIAWVNFRQVGHPAFADCLVKHRQLQRILSRPTGGAGRLDTASAQEFFLFADGPGSNSALVISRQSLAAGWHKQTKLADDLVLMATLLLPAKQNQCVVIPVPHWTKQQDADSFSHETVTTLQHCVDDFDLITELGPRLFSPASLRRWKKKAGNLRYKLAYQKYWHRHSAAAYADFLAALKEAGPTAYLLKLLITGAVRTLYRALHLPSSNKRRTLMDRILRKSGVVMICA